MAASALASHFAGLIAQAAGPAKAGAVARFDKVVDSDGRLRVALFSADGGMLLVGSESHKSQQAVRKAHEKLRALIATKRAFEYLGGEGEVSLAVKDADKVVAVSPPFATIEAMADAVVEAITAAETQARPPALQIVGEGKIVAPLTPAAAKAAFAKVPVAPQADDPYWQTLSTDETGKLLGVSRQTVIEWAKSGKLVGLAGAKRGLRIPAAQIRGGKPAPGLAMIAPHFGGPEQLWAFLVRPIVIDDQMKRPIELLFDDKIDRAARIAAGIGDHFG
jgi:hypothetical protein